MAGWLGTPRRTNAMITARQAQLRFTGKDYVDAMVAVNQAILIASLSGHTCSVTIETGENNVPLHVKQALVRIGYDVILNHGLDGDNTTEINIRW